MAMRSRPTHGRRARGASQFPELGPPPEGGARRRPPTAGGNPWSSADNFFAQGALRGCHPDGTPCSVPSRAGGPSRFSMGTSSFQMSGLQKLLPLHFQFEQSETILDPTFGDQV